MNEIATASADELHSFLVRAVDAYPQDLRGVLMRLCELVAGDSNRAEKLESLAKPQAHVQGGTVSLGIGERNDYAQMIGRGARGPRLTAHGLKTHPAAFDAVRRGLKTAEFRRDDRGFQVEDALILQEYDPDTSRFSGSVITAVISYINRETKYGIPEGYCMLSLKDIVTEGTG